jgi:opacity protein-like surface antigen
MFKSTSLAVFSAFIAAPTFAGGLTPTPTESVVVDPAPYIAPSADWTGFYLGASVNGGRLDNGVETIDTRGFGVHAGYLRDFGSFVGGGELAYAKGESSDTDDEFDAVRLKGIAGYDAGNFLPYVTLGMSRLSDDASSDTAMAYGVGAKYAFNPNWTAGLEYLVEQKDNFDDTGFDVENRELALRVDYSF